MKDLKPQSVESESNNKPLISKEIYDKILDKRMDEIIEMSKEINFDNLIYHFIGSSHSIRFTEFGVPMYTYNQLKNGDKTLSPAEEDQRKFRSDLGQISSGYRKSEHQLNTIKNVKNLFNSRQNIINLLNDNSRIRSEAFSKANKKTTGTGLKILTSKQLLQRLPIALTQVKTGKLRKFIK